MLFWNYTDSDVVKNLAIDEALLDHFDATCGSDTQSSSEILRVWEMPSKCVVLGRSSISNDEANLATCDRDGVPVLRRCSGGATILAGPGCLMYSVVLDIDQRPQLAMIDAAHDFVMHRVLNGLQRCGIEATRDGICDLTVQGKKISGNALRLKRRRLLYHGTLLYDFDIPSLATYLGQPARQPDYRQRRLHVDFVSNCFAGPADLTIGLRAAFDATEPLQSEPTLNAVTMLADQLVEQRYDLRTWNFSR